MELSFSGNKVSASIKGAGSLGPFFSGSRHEHPMIADEPSHVLVQTACGPRVGARFLNHICGRCREGHRASAGGSIMAAHVDPIGQRCFARNVSLCLAGLFV